MIITITMTSLSRPVRVTCDVSTWGETPQTRDNPGEPAGFEVEAAYIDGERLDLEQFSEAEVEDLYALVEAKLLRDGEAAMDSHAEYMSDCRSERWGA